ncbi:glycosyltransferase family A protein [Peribacillus huizhouensis]|uniref:Glycosyltransferase involved in cell wall biosynthesis n=1 Tax=Peribacillus huizhouensis TaxID=1501239 RepID=A0ABR6CKS4_9BACI|nr:glycosyltransferase family A protein [Peribacillus huizhouensis]MBA9025658.1 glycosyltransferase involved in cell wall biosynthesis [Peribacillus huizhouensis]
MDIEVLVSTMHQEDMSIINKMNIRGNAIIVNQCNYYDFTEINEKSRYIKKYSFNERGIGLSRNTALMRAEADICILADDDVKYSDNYQNIVLDAFENNQKADIIIFNVPSLNNDRQGPKEIKKDSKVNYFNFMRYGAVSIAFRRQSVIRANVFFSLLFGGGAKYSAGEDTLFIYECIKKGLEIYTNTAQIGTVSQEDSTWFKGHNKKYFYDKGILYATLSKKFSYLLILQYAIRKYNLYKNEMGMFQAIKYMTEGRRNHFV